VEGRIPWPNPHLLFWLSLIPFATAWVCETLSQIMTAIEMRSVKLVIADDQLGKDPQTDKLGRP